MLLFAWFICAIFCAIVASNKGRSGFGWLIVGAIFGIFGLLLAVGMPALDQSQRKGLLHLDLHPDRKYRKCPECAETIRSDAKRCRFCGQEFVRVGNLEKRTS